MEKIAIFVEQINGRGRLRPKHVGFVEREIKSFHVDFAPPFSGRGPFGPRDFNYVELSGNRWELQGSFFYQTGNELSIPSVILTKRHILPEDLFSDPSLEKA